MLDRTGNEVQHICQTHDWERLCWTFYLRIITYLLQQFLIFTDNNPGLLRNVLQWMSFGVSDKCKHNNKGKFLHPRRYRLHWSISKTTDPPAYKVFLPMQMSHIGLSLARSTAARTKLLQDPGLKAQGIHGTINGIGLPGTGLVSNYLADFCVGFMNSHPIFFLRKAQVS